MFLQTRVKDYLAPSNCMTSSWLKTSCMDFCEKWHAFVNL
jgi:hypothetical protein